MESETLARTWTAPFAAGEKGLCVTSLMTGPRLFDPVCARSLARALFSAPGVPMSSGTVSRSPASILFPDKLADGRAFQNIDEFKQLLLADKDQLARALTTKLLTYATGSAPTSADQPQIDAIVSKVRDKNYGVRALVHEIIQSELFLNK